MATRHIIQLDKGGRVVHEHAYETTAGTALDLTWDGSQTFYIANDRVGVGQPGTLSVVRVMGQGVEFEDIEPPGAPTNNREFNGITWIGFGHCILSVRVQINNEQHIIDVRRDGGFVTRQRSDTNLLGRGATCIRRAPGLRRRFRRRFHGERLPPHQYLWQFKQNTIPQVMRLAMWNIAKRSAIDDHSWGFQNHLQNDLANGWNFGSGAQGRGITHDGYNLWRIVDDGSTKTLTRYLPIGRKDWSAAEVIDISSTVGGTIRGLCNDGLYLYTLRN